MGKPLSLTWECYLRNVLADADPDQIVLAKDAFFSGAWSAYRLLIQPDIVESSPDMDRFLGLIANDLNDELVEWERDHMLQPAAPPRSRPRRFQS
jgi:hypothetical protein